jgi:hypothetical protein
VVEPTVSPDEPQSSVAPSKTSPLPASRPLQ